MSASRSKFLFKRGNTKLGKKILTFSLPAVTTCPGRSNLCEHYCYARRGFARYPSVLAYHQAALKASRKKSFVERVLNELSRIRKQSVVRIHVSGDFYDAAYANKWLQIMEACRDKRFYFYTRSWRLPEIASVFRQMAKLRHVRVWYSYDEETGVPPRTVGRIRRAYMLVPGNERRHSRKDVTQADPSGDRQTPPDLVFRVSQKTVEKRAAGALVCPAENGVTNAMCSSCELCFEEKKDPRRFSLTVIPA